MGKPAARRLQRSKRGQARERRKATKVAGKSDRELLEKLKSLIVEQVEGRKIKATVSDFVKLVQLEREIADGSLQEIEARWIDPPERPSADG